MHPTDLRTKYRQRRREKDSLTEQWNDDTQSQDTETLRHPFHDDMLYVLFPPCVGFQRYSFALPSSATTTLRSGFVELRSRDDIVVRPSSTIPLERRENTLIDITCLASEYLLLQTEKYQDNTHSIVRHCPWTGSHPLYFCLRSTLQSSSDNMTKIIDKRLTWTLRQREKKTTSSHSDQCHRARSGDDDLQEGLRSCVFSWYESLECGLV